MLKGNWTCIVVTCPTLRWASAIERELKLLQKKGFIAADVHLLTVEDPAERIGSGAATLNALLVTTEFLSALNNFTVITADVLQSAQILILHHEIMFGQRNYVGNVKRKDKISKWKYKI